MRPAVTILSILLACMFGAASPASAVPPTKGEVEPVPERPSLGSYWFPGLLSGGLIGLGAGYLQEREPHRAPSRSQWKTIGLWSGGGAAGGLVLSLAFAVSDRGGGQERGAGGYVLVSDLLGGTIAGVVLGGTVGVFRSEATHDSERTAYAAALGGLVGAGVGFLVGMLEMPKAYEKHARNVRPSVARVRDAAHRLTWLMGASGRF